MADGPAGFTQGSTCPALLRMPLGFMTLRVRDCHPLRLLFPEHSTRVNLATSRSYNPAGAGTPAVWAVPRSLATTWGITFCFLFLPVLRCFSSRGSLPHLVRVTVRQTAGLPHSEIRGSRVACTYPRLIAACRVLRRLPEPRHPPYALSCFLVLETTCKGSLRFLLEYTLGSTLRHVCFHTHKKCDALNIYVFVSLRFAFAYSMSKNAWSRSKRTGAESRGLEPQSGAGSPHSFVPYIDSTDSMGCIPKKERRPRTLKTRPATIAVSLVCERLQKGGVP